MNQSSPRICASCGKTFNGRADKKFCDDYCRSSFNNQQKSSNLIHVRNINKKLLRNRNILEHFFHNKAQQSRLTEKELYSKGFDFEYFTQAITLKNGLTCYYCYEYGYCVRNEHIKLFRNKHPDKVPRQSAA
jgi:hypothetical protein